jgi:hypothetical protein
MAETKETVIIDLQVQEQEAISSLANAKKAIVELKQQQADLNKEYKTGAKNLDEYAKESVQLEAALKKQQAQYSTIQRTVTGLKNPFDKLNDSIKEQAKSVTVAGVSLSTFANPATATIAILGGLFKAYASSTIGAKDLEFASNQLSAATGILTNQFAALFSSAKDGEGGFTKFLNSMMEALGPAGVALAAQSKSLAMAKEAIEDLGREEISIRADINERLEENATIMAKIQDSTTAYQEKISLVGEAIVNLRKNEEALLGVKEKQLDVLNRQLAADPENERIQTAVLEKEKEISRIKSDTERKVQNIIKLESNLNDIETKKVIATQERLDAEAKLYDDAYYQKLKRLDDEKVAESLAIDMANAEKADKDEALTARLVEIGNARLKELDKLYGKDTKNFKKSKDEQSKVDFLLNQNRLANAATAVNQIMGLVDKESDAYKALAISQAFIDTYRAAAAALAPPPIGAGPLFGPILAATTIGLGLANIAKIIGFASGGYTGDGGKYEPAGIVHKGEVVWNQRDVQAVGGPMMANAMRPTFSYADGGIVAGASTPAMPQMMQPKVILTYEEFKNFTNSVEFKDSIATA